MSNEDCLCMNLRTAAQALSRSYDAVLAPAGISANQFSLLNYIRSLNTPTVKALAEVSGLDRSTLGRNLRVLEKQDYISLGVGEDARTRVIALTPAGRKAVRQAAPLWQSIQDDLVGRLGLKKREQLREILTELTAAG